MKLSSIQEEVLKYLQAAGDYRTLNEITQALQVHLNSIRLAVTKLTNIGLIERKYLHDGKRGRPILAFRVRTGKFNILYDAFRSIERATDTEKEIIENIISGKYELCLADEKDLIGALANFLKDLGVSVQVSASEIKIASEKYSEVDQEIPGFSGRVYRVIAQQAVGERAAIILKPELSDGYYVLSVTLKK